MLVKIYHFLIRPNVELTQFEKVIFVHAFILEIVKRSTTNIVLVSVVILRKNRQNDISFPKTNLYFIAINHPFDFWANRFAETIRSKVHQTKTEFRY